MAAVVGHEDHGSRDLLAEHLTSLDAAPQIDVEQRSENAGEDASPHDPRQRAARPGHVHLPVLARDLLTDAGASRAQLVPDLGQPVERVAAHLRHARLKVAGARSARPHRGVEPPSLPHARLYSTRLGWFRPERTGGGGGAQPRPRARIARAAAVSKATRCSGVVFDRLPATLDVGGSDLATRGERVVDGEVVDEGADHPAEEGADDRYPEVVVDVAVVAWHRHLAPAGDPREHPRAEVTRGVDGVTGV